MHARKLLLRVQPGSGDVSELSRASNGSLPHLFALIISWRFMKHEQTYLRSCHFDDHRSHKPCQVYLIVSQSCESMAGTWSSRNSIQSRSVSICNACVILRSQVSLQILLTQVTACALSLKKRKYWCFLHLTKWLALERLIWAVCLILSIAIDYYKSFCIPKSFCTIVTNHLYHVLVVTNSCKCIVINVYLACRPHDMTKPNRVNADPDLLDLKCISSRFVALDLS